MKKLFYSVFAIVIAFTSCNKGDKANTITATDQRIEPVRVIQLSNQKVSHTIEYQATLNAFEEIHLAPASPGRIDAIYGEVGDRVSKGTLLVQMDRTQLHQAEVQLKNITTNFKRYETLQKVGSIAQQQYDQLETQYEVAKSNVDFLKENTRLLSPFNGVISGKYFEAGEMYSAVPNTESGKAAILSLVQIDKLKAIVAISEKYFPQIKNGMTTSVISDIYPGKSFTGHVSLVHPTINAASRTFNVEVTIDNNQKILRPGMFCRVTFSPEETEAIVLPALAVLKMQGSNDRYLFIEQKGISKRIPVTLGQRFDDNVEVISDQLKLGDNIIISGQARLLDGMKVKVITE